MDDYLRVKGHPDIFAIGDCCNGYPALAQVAQQQANYLVKQLNNQVEGKKISPFKYVHLLSLAYLGGWRGVVDVRQHDVKGFIGFIVWRSAYLTKSVSLQNKILIPMVKDFFFLRIFFIFFSTI